MIRRLLCVIVSSCFPLALVAQETPRAEGFAGYSYMRASDVLSEGINQNGWELSAAANFTRSIGVVADFSNHYGSKPNVSTMIGRRGKGFTFLFGPQYSYRRIPRLTPFVRVLFGGIHASKIVPDTFSGTGGGFCGSISCFLPTTAFAMALGGGMDVKVTDRVWVRAFQAEYFRTNLDNASQKAAGQNDVRISAGIVFHFGKRE
jgi:opacity protein-like surface antigen